MLFQIYWEFTFCMIENTPSKQIRTRGISEFKIKANYSKIFLYQKGWFNSESPELKYKDSSHLLVAHEIVHLLDYDNKRCIDDENYRNDICKHDFIYKVGNVDRQQTCQNMLFLYQIPCIMPKSDLIFKPGIS